MRWMWMAVLLAAGTGRGQSVIDVNRISPSLRNFAPVPGEIAFKCDVSPVHPTFNFSFRFQTGYVVSVPMKQYPGEGHGFVVLTRVTPETGGNPVYLVDRIRLPKVPDTKASVEFGGAFLTGEGRYRVEWEMFDETNRVCRKSWRFSAKRNRNERRVAAAIEPGTISGISLRGVRRPASTTDDAQPFRLTVLLHVAPISPRRTRMSARDRVMLTGALSALLERLPTKSVRMVAFTLDQQKEMFRQDDFSLANLDQVSRAINETEMGTVDFKILANRRGHTEMMAKILNSEINHPNPSDVVLVLGPASRFYDRIPQGSLEKPSSQSPRFFFLRYGPQLRMYATLTDTIGIAISKVRGKNIVILNPGDFAKAIETVERQAAGGN